LKFDGLLLISISLLLLIFIQRLLQKEIQIILLLLTGKPALAIGIFSILLLPGVFIHEFSHLLMALILRVPIRKFSLIPEMGKNGKIRLGFVQTAKTDLIRDSLIGLAPFISGLILLALIATSQLGIIPIISDLLNDRTNINIFMEIQNIFLVQDFGLWFYLAFAISTTMVPSESDRQSWKIIILVLALLFGLFLVAGLGNWMIVHIFPTINQWFYSISFVLLGSVVVHFLILLPSWVLRKIISMARQVTFFTTIM
jgi:hypothetical protein